MALQEVIAGIQDIAGGVSGIRVAPDYAPDVLNIYPACIAYPDSGTLISESDAWYVGLHNIRIELHFEKKELHKVLEKAIPLGEDLYEALMADPTFGGTVSTYNQITYEMANMEYSGIKTFGWRFTITDVKLMGTLS